MYNTHPYYSKRGNTLGHYRYRGALKAASLFSVLKSIMILARCILSAQYKLYPATEAETITNKSQQLVSKTAEKHSSPSKRLDCAGAPPTHIFCIVAMECRSICKFLSKRYFLSWAELLFAFNGFPSDHKPSRMETPSTTPNGHDLIA
ncbi:hypothetical protein KQX54_002671 [Cotesia glomerata]|uniref:Uncharacterized protein n=1 Tax=Cotesia glomerata TaxID=32391 RepID=A0AAV7J1K4_COTGL|nr:hypothetical protein KQX54_002671 [Cotesia glomerata]